MSENFNPRVEVHNGEGLTITLRPDEKQFSTLDKKESEIVLSFNDEDVDDDGSVRYETQVYGVKTITDDIFKRTKHPRIIDPIDGLNGWTGIVKWSVEVEDGVKNNFIQIVEISKDGTFRDLVNYNINLDIDERMCEFNFSELGRGSKIFIRVSLVSKTGYKNSSSTVMVYNDNFYLPKNKQELIDLLNAGIGNNACIDTRFITELDYLWVNLNDVGKIMFTDGAGCDRFSFSNVVSMRYTFGYPDNTYHGTINNIASDIFASDPSIETNIGHNIVDFGHAKYNSSFLLHFNLRNVEDMEGIFRYSLIGSTYAQECMSNWDTSSVRNLKSAFEGISYNPLDLKFLYSWDTSNVIDFSYCFHLCNLSDTGYGYELKINNENITGALSGWDMRKARTIKGMFYITLNSPFILGKCLESCVDASHMYHYATWIKETINVNYYDGAMITCGKNKFENIEYIFKSAVTDVWGSGSLERVFINFNNNTLKIMRYSFAFNHGLSCDFTQSFDNVIDITAAFACFRQTGFGSPIKHNELLFPNVTEADFAFFGNYIKTNVGINSSGDVEIIGDFSSVVNGRFMFANFLSEDSKCLDFRNITFTSLVEAEGMFSCLSAYGKYFPEEGDNSYIEVEDYPNYAWFITTAYGDGIFLKNVEIRTLKYLYNAEIPIEEDYLDIMKRYTIYSFVAPYKMMNSIKLPTFTSKLRNLKSFFAGQAGLKDIVFSEPIDFNNLPECLENVEDMSFFIYSNIPRTCWRYSQDWISSRLFIKNSYPNLKKVDFFFGMVSNKGSKDLTIIERSPNLESMAFFIAYDNPSFPANPLEISDFKNIKDISGYCHPLSNLGRGVSLDITPMLGKKFKYLDFAFSGHSWYNYYPPEGYPSIVGNIKDLDVSECVSMQGIFKYNVEFDQDISNWNVSNVENWTDAFTNCNIRESFKPPKFR